MAVPRYFVEDPLSVGACVSLDAGRARHVGAVLRLGREDRVRVFNGRDGEWRARIVSQDKRGVALDVEERVREARACADVILLFAPVKRAATDLIVEKATEMGARALWPVMTARTIAETVRRERLDLIAREACEQSERFAPPDLRAPAPLARVLGEWDASRALIYADEAGDDDGQSWGGARGRAAPIAEALGGLGADGRALAYLVGPEGGFTSDERRALRACAFVTPVSLGPRILRAETAVIAGLAVIQAIWGDWRADSL